MAKGNKVSGLVGPVATKTNAAQERRWQAEDALRTITRAQEIQRDRPLMREVKRVAAEQVKTLQRVTQNGGGMKNGRK
jgi:hypothetical protein